MISIMDSRNGDDQEDRHDMSFMHLHFCDVGSEGKVRT